ncbi:MAG: YggS family pyridoxal phosphate-dependent enzyme [Gemmatimonadota bacterium]|nr:YggS family pyridoxal phosphate-dependent enzyme [Gemmatimonadota bacterium]
MAFEGLSSRLAAVREEIADQQVRAGLTHEVRIVAVTKSHGPDAVLAALAAGLSMVGENRVQEALRKQEALPDLPVAWHLIGSLQRNKARQAVGRFALIHSVDRVELADELARRVPEGQRQAILVEVNCAGESQKGGVAPAGLDAFLAHLDQHPALDLQGLMTMAPFTADVSVQRTCFARLYQLRDRCVRSDRALPELSMGMSGDYPAAVAEGATMLRLGTVLFGEREP